MAFKVKRHYSADFFKKHKKESCEQDLDNVEENSSVATLTNANLKEANGESVAGSKSHDKFANEFTDEDKKMTQLYRKVVDEMMSANKLTESAVDRAIAGIKQKISLGHKRGFRRFPGIDFCKTSNRCGYLRRYAICHTGLVKKLVWHFFSDSGESSKNVKEEILSKNTLKVVSLGGGPGNDLVGFCAALQETANDVQQLDLKIIDISQGWVAVLSSILGTAKTFDSGKLSELLQTKTIKTAFIQADLNEEGIFEDATMSSTIGEADVILMVKLASFIAPLHAVKLIQNVANAMTPEAKFIFIDSPYDEKIFRDIPSLDFIYKHHIKYDISFKYTESECASINSSQANIAIFEKCIIVSEEESLSKKKNRRSRKKKNRILNRL